MKKLPLITILFLTISLLFGAAAKEEINVTSSEFSAIDSRDLVISLEQKPTRIVSLSPNITEILFELGLDDYVVGRTDYCDYPTSALEVTSVGDLFSPSVEKIVSLGAELVIISNLGQKETVEALENAQIKVAYFNEAETMEGTYNLIKKVANLTGTTSNALTIIENMKQTLLDVESNLNATFKPTVYYVAGFGEWGDFTATGDTYINDLIKLAGAENIASDATGWYFQREILVARDPQVIILPTMTGSTFEETKKEFVSHAAYSNLSAVLNEKIIFIENNLIERQGPRSAIAVKELAKALKEVME